MRVLCGPLCRSTSPLMHIHVAVDRCQKTHPSVKNLWGTPMAMRRPRNFFRAVFHASRTASVKQGGILIERSRCGHLSGRGTLK